MLAAIALLTSVWSLEPAVRVSGEDLAWKVETPYFMIDLGKNPGTGRSGQINTIYMKDPGVLLTRARPTSTLHLSPNAAAGGQWNGINRWNPPERHTVKHGPASFRVEREGPMPYVPNLRVKTAYEFFADRPAIAVEESIEATADARVSLLRLCEWSFATGAENPFTHLGWEDATGKVTVLKKEKEAILPLDTRWMAFFNEARSFGFAAVLESFDAGVSPLIDPSSRFAGDPHYFYRTLIHGENGALVTVPRGARYTTRYWVYYFRSFDEVSRFYQSVQKSSRADAGTAGKRAELSVSIREAARPTAAAVRLHDAAGQLVIPDDALELGAMGHLYAAGSLIHYADWTSTRVRSQDLFFGSSYFRAAHPKGTACFFVDGGFRATVAPGRYTLVVSKGLEYTPVERTIDIDDSRTVTVDLERWVDMTRSGWYSGDGHVHIQRATPAVDRAALLWAAAEDVRAVNVLLMGDQRETYYSQYAYGVKGTAAGKGSVLIPGQEEPRTAELGHTLHLGIAAPVRDAANYYSYVPLFERIRESGGLNGFAHVGRRRWFFKADRGLSLTAPLNLVDFVEIAQMGYIGVNTWYEFLNLGFRLTAMAGSDVPWGGTIGCARVYTKVEGRFNPARWIEAVRQGRTFVTTGPMLDFTVDSRAPGSVLRLKKGQAVQVRARAWSGPRGPRPARLKIVAFGKTLRETPGDPIAFDFKPERSLWITAVSETNERPLMDAPGYFSGAAATPVYVEVDGAPTRDAERLDELIASRLKSLDAVDALLRAGRNIGGAAEVRAQVEKARS